MEIRVLIIDDTKDDVALSKLQRDLKDAVNADSFEEVTVHLNFLDPSEIMDEGGLSGLISELEGKYFKLRLDLLLCDFNLHKEEKLLAYEIVIKCREMNKNCSIVMYSGNPFKDLVRLEHEGLSEYLADNLVVDGEKPLDKAIIESLIEDYIKKNTKDYSPLEKASCSNIQKFVDRKSMTDAAISCLLKPSSGLRLERALEQHSNLVLNGGVPDIDGTSLSCIASNIRLETEVGRRFEQQILDTGLSLLLDNND